MAGGSGSGRRRADAGARGVGSGGGAGGADTTPDGVIAVEGPLRPGEPTLRWRSRARSIEEIEAELARIWAEPNLTTTINGVPGRHVAARTNVMNLVVIARRSETAQHCAATIQALTARHPSRTLIVSPADPDGPAWLDANIHAHCVLPRPDAPEVCAEMLYVTAGGDSGRHLDAIVTPLLIHDLPVTIWWPDEPPFGTELADDLLAAADRLVVDGSAWSGDGLVPLRRMASLVGATPLTVSDFALLRQSRWRDAIASIFDIPEFLPYLRHLRRIAVTCASRDEEGDPRPVNLVKPVYHVAWLASRLGLRVMRPLQPVEVPARRGRRQHAPPAGSPPPPGPGWSAALGDGRSEVGVVIRPVRSPMPPGTTLRVELLAERRGRELRAEVTAEAETVTVRAWQDGVEALERPFHAPRRGEVELLAEAIEACGPTPVTHDTIVAAAQLAGGILRDDRATGGARSGGPYRGRGA